MQRKFFTSMATLLVCGATLLSAANAPDAMQGLAARFPATVGRIIQPEQYHRPTPKMNLLRDLNVNNTSQTCVIHRAAALPVITGNMINSNVWEGRLTGYGVYQFNPVSNLIFNKLGTGEKEKFTGNGGAIMKDGHYYLTNWGAGLTSLSIKAYVYNATTWELEQTYGVSDPRVVATDLAYDRINDVIYGAFFRSDLSGWELGTLKYDNGYPVRETTIGNLPMMVIALGVNSAGELYGICEDGVLYKFDKNTADATRIGDTGIKVASSAGVVQQSGEFDQHSDTFYWAANDVYGNYALYIVDTNNASLSKVSDIVDKSHLINLQVMAPSANDSAPNFLQNLSATFNDGCLTGSITFTLPEDTYDGTAISGNLDYTIALNGEVKASGIAAAGSSVSRDITAEAGENLIEVWASNSNGNSPVSSTKLWIGDDIPEVQSVEYIADGYNSTVKWTVSANGIHNGYTGNTKFKVVRMPDNYVVAQASTGMSVTDRIPEDAPLAKYYYLVTPCTATLEGTSMKSNGNIIGSTLDTPYLQTFDSPDDVELMHIIDANKDGISWEWTEQSVYNDNGVAAVNVPWGTGGTPSHDDWILTPNIRLEAGKEYELSFKILTRHYATSPEDRFMVAFGQGTDPKKYKTLIPETTIKYTANLNEFKVTFNSTQEQEIHVGIRRICAGSSSNMMVDDIRLVSLGSSLSPAQVQNLNVIPDPTGMLRATVEFDAPTLTKGEMPLATITHADIYIGNNLLHSFDNITPGEHCSKVVEVPDNGTHTFRVEIFNEEGMGLEATTTQFVGVDEPGNFKAWVVDGGDCFTLKWEACSTGITGNYVNPDLITYSIYTTDGLYLSEPLATGIKGTEVSIKYNMDEGEQMGIMFAVRAHNDAGESRPQSTNALIVGKPYDIPYDEHFDYSSNYIYDMDTSDDLFGFATGVASDGDNKSIVWMSSFDDALSKEFKTLKINLGGAESPKLRFDYKMSGKNSISVYAIMPDGSEEFLTKYTNSPSSNIWNSALIDLAKYSNLRYIRLKYVFEKGDSDDILMAIDNMQIRDAVAHDLEVSLKLPASNLHYGECADIYATITNRGYEESGKFYVSVYANGEIIGEQSAQGLEFGKTTDFYFNHTIPTGAEDGIEIKAVVTYDEDMRPDNNETIKIMTVQLPKVSEPVNLECTGDLEPKLSWQAPTEFYSEDVVEDFERYEAATIGNLGDWTMVDMDKGNVINLEDATYINDGKPQAFTVFNPYSFGIGGSYLYPHSGVQCLACIATDINSAEHNDDWLISPLLTGEAQTVSFYAKSLNDFYNMEKIEVLYSNSSTDVADFVKVTEFELTNYETWERYEFDVPDGALYFAIRVVTTDGYICLIDDVSFTAGSCKDIISWNIYRDNNFLAPVSKDSTSFTDTTATGNHKYNVTAVYADGNESKFSNSAEFISSSVEKVFDEADCYTVVNMLGQVILRNAKSLNGIPAGIYIINGKKTVIR